MKFPKQLIVTEPNPCMVRDLSTGNGLFSTSREYAKEIVKRWNAYRRLVQDRKVLIQALKDMRDRALEMGWVKENHPIIECNELIDRLENPE